MVFWRRFKQKTAIWRAVALPGLLLIVLVLLIRLVGLLQIQEWMAFDALSRSCPASATATEIVIVGIDEADLRTAGGFPIPDQTLANGLRKLQKYQPAVIGVNLFRDMPVQPGHEALMQLLAKSTNLVGIEMALNPMPNLNIAPPPALPPEQIGLVDATIDADGKLRRMILVAKPLDESATSSSRSSDVSSGNALSSQSSHLTSEPFKHAFALQLVKMYLASPSMQPDRELGQSGQLGQGQSGQSGQSEQSGALRFERFQANTGGYVRANASADQILLNFCASQRRFQTLSLTQVLEEKFDPALIRDRIVIIGMTAPSVKDVFFTAALRETLSSSWINQPLPDTQLLYGVEVQAHAVAQLLNTGLNRQPALRHWAEPWEYLWIAVWGLVGIGLEILLQAPWKSLLGLTLAMGLLVGVCFLALMLGWWLPLVPAGLALGGAGLITTFFDRDLRFELEHRRLAVERLYEAVHNGPLQQLAVILRNLDGDTAPERLRQQLQALNEDLRSLFEHMRQAMLTRSDRLYLKGNLVLDLQDPISDLLYQVYNVTLEIQTPGFSEIQTYISPDFESLKRNRFSVEQKRGLCLFLQEALWNVGNHAIGATRLDVLCFREANRYVLRITDNGIGDPDSHEGQGTRQARMIAWQLRGRFQRRSNYPQGTICELIFPMQNHWWSGWWSNWWNGGLDWLSRRER